MVSIPACHAGFDSPSRGIFFKTIQREFGIPFKKVFNEASQAVRVFFYDPVGNAIELNQENNTLNLFSLTQDKIEETKVKLEQSIDLPKQPEWQPESQLPSDS